MSVIVVGAGPGIGAAVARRFARESVAVGLIARDGSRLQALAGSLAGPSAVRSADVTDAAALTGAIDELSDELGAPTALVYNAALMRPGQPSELDAAALSQQLAVDVVGALTACNAAVKHMERGALLLTGGGFADRPFSGYTGLSVGKAAIRNLARCMAQEYAERGIHVATVTIHGRVEHGTPFDPDRIAELYWVLYREPRAKWRTEVDFRG